MSYLQYLLIFLVAPTAVLFAYHGPLHIRRVVAACGLAAAVMVVAGVPWLHALVQLEVWGWDPAKVTFTTWDVPWDAAAFFVLQAFFTGVLAVLALRRPWGRK